MAADADCPMELIWWEWAALLVASATIGFAKTAIGGAGTLAVVIFAAVLPARESTGVLLPLLIAADLIAIWVYRRDADWATLLRLFPTVAVGILLGAWFLSGADDASVKRIIAALVLTGVALTVRNRLRAARSEPPSPTDRRSLVGAGATGVGTGFTSMVANAAGPLMALYLLFVGLDVRKFVGTTAWFFFVVNLAKLPFSAGLGLVTAESIRLDATLAPMILVGAAGGTALIKRVSQAAFEWWVLAAAGLSAGLLLL
jgi:uncharacterized membrane protein YfcA